jgi:hypothetical protein
MAVNFAKNGLLSSLRRLWRGFFSNRDNIAPRSAALGQGTKNAYTVRRPSTFYQELKENGAFLGDDVRTISPGAAAQPKARTEPRAAARKHRHWLPGAPAQKGVRPVEITLLGTGSTRTFRVDAGGGLDVGSRVIDGIRLELPGIRAKHCQFFCHNDMWFIGDWGVGQTLVNGSRVVGAVRLEPGDLITLGSISMVFEGEERVK